MPVTYTETDGGKLAVELDGPDDGPLVILSPGLGDTRASYGPLAQQLVAAGYRVARVDLRGHGDSSTTFARHGDEATADDLLLLADTLGSSQRVVLGGASLSGGAVTIAAGRRPDKVAGILLFCAFLRNGSFGRLMHGAMAVAFLRPWGPALWRSYAATLWPGLGPVAATKRAAATTDLLTRPGYWPAFYATTRGADHSVVGPWLSKARHVPALVVIGSIDPDWSDPIAEAAWVASNFDRADTVVAPGCGHAPMLEAPDLIGPAALTFLDSIRDGSSFQQPRSSTKDVADTGVVPPA